MASNQASILSQNLEGNAVAAKNFNFSKKAKLIQRAKKLQAHQTTEVSKQQQSQNAAHNNNNNTQDNYQDLKRNPLTESEIYEDRPLQQIHQQEPTWKFVQQSDNNTAALAPQQQVLQQNYSGLETSKMTETESSGEEQNHHTQAAARGNTGMTIKNFQVEGQSQRTYDERTSETNSQYQYDQGRPDLLQRLRSMQGYQQKEQNQAPDDSMEQSNTMSSANEQMSEPQIMNAPRQMIPQNAEVMVDSRPRSQNKMNLQIEIELQNNNNKLINQSQDVQSFSSANQNDIQTSSMTTIEQSNECIKISDLVELQKHKTLEVERLNNNSLLSDTKKNYNQHQYQQSSSHNDSHARYGDEQSLSYQQQQQQQQQEHKQDYDRDYTGDIPLDHMQQVDVKSDDVHPLPQIISQSRSTNAQHQHARYQSSQGISSPAAYGQNGVTSQQNARVTYKNSSAQDSGTVYATCLGSSQEKHGRNGTLSFHTAQSQIMPNEDGYVDYYTNLQYQQQQQRYMDPEERNEMQSLDEGVSFVKLQQKYIQRSSNKQRPESAREPITSSSNKNQQTNSNFIRQGSSGKRRNQNHNDSFNYGQGQRTSTDGLNGPMHNQFSFGHLQSSDGKMCAVSEAQMVRDNDSINQQSRLLQQKQQIGAKDSILSQTNTDEQNTTTVLNQDLIQGGHQQQLQNHQDLQQQENVPYTSVHTSSQMEKNSLYHQLFNQVRQQLEHQQQQQQQQQQMPPSYQVRQENQNKRITTTTSTIENNQHAVSTSDRKFEEYLVAKNHQQLQNFQQQNLTANKDATATAQAAGKPPKFRMRKPETFNESMYQRSQAWLLQKTQRVQIQKRESALKEAEECTFNPNSAQLTTTTSQQMNMMQQTQTNTAGTKKRRAFNSTQRSKRSQVRQRDQLINHSGHHHNNSVTPQSYLNQTMHFKQKNYSKFNETQNNLSMVNDIRLHTDTSPIANFDNSYTTTINNDRSQSRDESTIIQEHQPLQQEKISPKFETMVEQPASRNNRNFMSHNSMNMHHNQHQSIVSSGLGSQFNRTVRVKSATSADYRVRQARLISDKRNRQPNFQDGNLTSFRAIESYQKHLERQTVKIEKKIEAEQAEKKRPGSGNLWRYKLTQPASPKLRSLERSRLKEYAKNKKTFLRGDGLSKSAEREGRAQGSIGGGSNSIDSCGKYRTQQIISAHNTIQPVMGKSSRSPSKRIDMSVLCQSNNMKESLIRAKNGLSLDDTQKFSSLNYASGSHTPFIVSQQLQNLSSKQPTSYRNQMMAQKANQKSQKNQQQKNSSRQKTSFIRPKSCAKKATQSNKKEGRPSSSTYSQQKAKKQIKQQQLQQFVEQPQMGYGYGNQYHHQQHQLQQQQQNQQFMTCQSTMSDFAKANDMIQQINPHSSIQTQLIPDGFNEPLLLQMNDNQKSNTQIIDISQFNTFNENASAFRDSTSQLQDRCSRPSSSVNGAPINLITTGAYTVEHAGGTGLNTEDDQSFNTNIDFLGHFGATSSIMGDQIPQTTTNDFVEHNNQLIMAESGQHLFESFNPHQQRQQKYQQNHDYIEHSNPHMQVIEENRKSSTSANEVLMMPHQHRYGVTMENDQPRSGDQQAAQVSRTASSTALYTQAEQINIKEFIRNQIGGL